MAVTVTPVATTNRYVRVYDVTAADNADTEAVIPADFDERDVADDAAAAKKIQVFITPLLGAAYTSAWSVSEIKAAAVKLAKEAGGGGAANAQIRVTLMVGHSTMLG